MHQPNLAFITRRYRILSHLAFWLAYYLFFVLQYKLILTSYSDWQWAISLSITIWPDIAATYFTCYVLIPRLILKRKYVLFALLFLPSAGAFVLFQRWLVVYIIIPLIRPESAASLNFWTFNPFYTFMNIYSIVAVFAVIKMMKTWFNEQQRRVEIENQQKQSELAMLRTQISPHFLFNTLNNIDTLVMTDREKASDAIIRLSEIMRYMLYDSNSERVELGKEIEYLQSYVSLQKLRLQNPNLVSFVVKGDYTGRHIAPLFFIPFIENAFKHGLKNKPEEGIEILLSIGGNEIRLTVTNYYDDMLASTKDKTPGIGLINVRRRLELIYPQRHKLDISQDRGKFKVTLSIFES